MKNYVLIIKLGKVDRLSSTNTLCSNYIKLVMIETKINGLRIFKQFWHHGHTTLHIGFLCILSPSGHKISIKKKKKKP